MAQKWPRHAWRAQSAYPILLNVDETPTTADALNATKKVAVVLGARGGTGAQLCSQLITHGYIVRAVVRNVRREGLKPWSFAQPLKEQCSALCGGSRQK